MFERVDLGEGKFSAVGCRISALESGENRSQMMESEFLALFIFIQASTGSFDCASSFAKSANELASLRMTGRFLADFFGPGFQVLFYLGHELVGYCSVDQAVVVA
jgi:hypothetical protein